MAMVHETCTPDSPMGNSGQGARPTRAEPPYRRLASNHDAGVRRAGFVLPTLCGHVDRAP